MGELLNLDPASVLLGFWLLEDHFPKNLGIFSFVQKKSPKKNVFFHIDKILHVIVLNSWILNLHV